MAKGETTGFLIANGWERRQFVSGICRDVSDDLWGTGECQHGARWSKWGRELCAQHAAKAERIDQHLRAG